MREFLTYGSVRGVLGNWHSYRDGKYALLVTRDFSESGVVGLVRVKDYQTFVM